MPSGTVLAIAAAAGLLFWGGKATYDHAIKPADHAIVKASKATGCGVEKVFTLGHKGCAEKVTK